MILSIDEVVKHVNGRLINGKENISINGVSTDSREVFEGNLFVPLKGEQYDGHNFVTKAKEAGAVATLWQDDLALPNVNIPIILVLDTLIALQDLALYYRKKINPIVIGVTGSNGKTTTKDIISSTLINKYKVHKTKGNLNNHIGVPLTLLTMPENTEVAVIEMGMSNIGEIEKLSTISLPDYAVITNVGESHIEYLVTRDNIAKAKLEILKGLKGDGFAILPGDELLIRSKISKIDGIENIIWVGQKDTNDVYPLKVNLNNLDGVVFTDSNNEEYSVPLLGIHNVVNALMAIQVAKKLGVNKQDIQQGLTNIELTGMRLEKLYAKNGCLVLNDTYNASPTSMKASLELFASLNQFKHKAVVLGDMLELGVKSEKYHEEIGRVCANINLDYLIVTGELGKSIIKGAKDSGINDEKVKYFEDINQISEFILEHVSPEAVILVKSSRGIKLERVIDQIRT